MVKVTAALFIEQNVKIAVVSVKYQSCLNEHDRKQTLNGVSRFFPDANTVIVWETPNRKKEFYGRQDIVNFLSRVHPSRLPWKEYSFA